MKLEVYRDVCQREAHFHHMFLVALQNDSFIFKDVAYCDFIIMHGNTLLHITYLKTKFAAAYFLDSETSTIVWEVLLAMCVVPHSVFWDLVKRDQPRKLTSAEWKNSIRRYVH